MSPNVVSGAVSTVTDLGKDGTWLQAWLKEQPARLGLGDLTVADGSPVQDADGNPAFLASDDDRYFCVDVQLGELEAAQGFGVLHNWARNRVRHPDKNHVAVLVTESTGERYRETLEALTEHLPLVVVELQVWQGENEAIIVPHIALASADVDLASTPAAAAARAVARSAPSVQAILSDRDAEKPDDTTDDGDTDAASDTSEPGNKDDTGIDDPWRLPRQAAVESGSSVNGSVTGIATR